MKTVYIGLFSANGQTAIIYHENGKPKTFGSYQQANAYIVQKCLGVNASPIEIYED